MRGFLASHLGSKVLVQYWRKWFHFVEKCPQPFTKNGINCITKMKVIPLQMSKSNFLERPFPYTEPVQQFFYDELDGISGAELMSVFDFVFSMLQMDFRDRPTPSDLLKHRWLSERIFTSNDSCICGTLNSG
jgi:hypothetical protein